MIGTILWAESNSAHHDHIHVEPATRSAGVPPLKNPGMTPGVQVIYNALEQRFGKGAYFVNPPVGTEWTHMGGWNRRVIAGTTIWSQHSWWNALDIGPLYGASAQREVYDFLVALRDGTLQPQEDEVPKIPKPDWLDQKILDRLLAAKVIVSMPVEETLDYWRMLVLQDRTLTAAKAVVAVPAATPAPHTHTATVTSVVAVS